MTVQTSAAQHTEGMGEGWSFLHSRRWIGYFSLLIVFAVACVFLGNWQFERRAEARAEIDRIDANYGGPAVPLAEEVPNLAEFDEDTQKWQTVEVTGEYVGEPFFARNRPGPEGVGANMIHALHTGTGHVFFVDRGWIPYDAESGNTVGTPQPFVDQVTVTARLRASEAPVPGRSSHGVTVGSINLPELARLASAEDTAYTGAYGMLISESPAGDHGVLPPKPERDEGPHLSYALQWYVFILIGVLGVAYAARQEYRGLNAGSEQVRKQDQRSADRKKKRGPTDADEEDAMLDGYSPAD
ncbi:MAG: SURF1 family cytochrome oxidase biogenesis protein [Leucobacter sp.]